MLILLHDAFLQPLICTPYPMKNYCRYSRKLSVRTWKETHLRNLPLRGMLGFHLSGLHWQFKVATKGNCYQRSVENTLPGLTLSLKTPFLIGSWSSTHLAMSLSDPISPTSTFHFLTMAQMGLAWQWQRGQHGELSRFYICSTFWRPALWPKLSETDAPLVT